MTDEKKIERLENRLKEVTSWWRAAEKQFLQKCKETKANQKTIERLKAENKRTETALYCLAKSFAEALCKDGNPQNLIEGFIKDAYVQAEKESQENK